MKKRLLVLAALFSLLLMLVAASTSTADCFECRSPGYYKNHGDMWPNGVNIDGVPYYASDLKQPVAGDKCITMLKALVAAKLNPSDCVCSDPYPDTIGSAEAWFAQYCSPSSSVEASSTAWQCEGESLYEALDASFD